MKRKSEENIKEINNLQEKLDKSTSEKQTLKTQLKKLVDELNLCMRDKDQLLKEISSSVNKSNQFELQLKAHQGISIINPLFTKFTI
jgi:hypothetical protein